MEAIAEIFGQGRADEDEQQTLEGLHQLEIGHIADTRHKQVTNNDPRDRK